MGYVPGQTPLPGMGGFVHSACRPGYNSMLSTIMLAYNIHSSEGVVICKMVLLRTCIRKERTYMA